MSVPQYFSITIGYKDVYDDYDKFNINEELKNIPSVIWLKIIAQVNAWMHSNQDESVLQSEYFDAWIVLLPKELSEKVKQWTLRIRGKGSKSNLINNKTSLMLIEKIYENFNDIEFDDNISEDYYRTFFKCYIYLSQCWAEEAQKITSSKTNGKERYLHLFFPLQFSMDEIVEQKDFRLQFLKGIYFFNYCEGNPDYNEALKRFIELKGVVNWQRYLIDLLGPYIKIRPSKDESPVSSLQITGSNDLKKVYDSFCANPSTYKKLDDYKYLRNYPLYKYKENYIFVFPNFFVDKLYQALKFDFGYTLIESGFPFKGKRINSLTDFLRAYGEDFAEKGLFYQVLEFCFQKKKNYVLKRGEDLKKILKGGEPDYYIRDKSKIYLFEFKDTLISHSAKSSINYNAITQELDKKLIQNERGDPKGLKQLVNSILRMSSGDYNRHNIDSFENEKIIIYPILIFTDATLYVRGVNYYLNQKFTSLLEESKIRLSKIKPLTLISIDSLIKFQDLFHEKKISLNQCLNYFHESIQGTDIEKQVSTFEASINKVTSKLKFDNTPKMFWENIKDVMEKRQVIDSIKQ